MSYYNIYPEIAINYMVCSSCGTQAFAWLADLFSCSVCGSDRYSYPGCPDTEHASGYKEAEVLNQLMQDYCDEIRRHFADLERRLGQPGSAVVTMTMMSRGKKRKRSLSDDGGR
jgi:hypothetical protein